MTGKCNGAGGMPPRRRPWQGSPPSALPDANPEPFHRQVERYPSPLTVTKGRER
jgi:hypothetical protein